MATLFEMLTRKKQQPTPVVQAQSEETKHYNPLRAKIGGVVRINTIDLENLNFIVRSIREIRTTIDGQVFYMADYDLLARPVSGPEVKQRLRLVPNGDSDTCDIVLLNFVADFPYDQPYHQGLSWDNNQGEAVEGDAKFWRVGDVHDPWEVETASLMDKNGDGKVDANEVRKGHLTYWDFWRDTKDTDGVDIREFYIVEMDGVVKRNSQGDITKTIGSGQFQIWRGSQIAANRVSIS